MALRQQPEAIVPPLTNRGVEGIERNFEVLFQDLASAYVAGGTDVALADGGTNASLTAVAGGVVYSTSSALAITAAGSSGQVLVSAGTGTPVWQSAAAAVAHNFLSATHTDTVAGAAVRGSVVVGNSTPAWAALALGATGTILRSNGSDLVYTTATYPATTTINQLLYSSAANTVSGLTTAVSHILVTDGSGVPAWATDIPTAVTIGSAYIYRAGGTDVPVADGGTGVSTFGGSNTILYTTSAGVIASTTALTYDGTKIVGNWQGFVDTTRYGFLNQTETTIAFDGTSVFTLADAGSGWSYYRTGLKHTISGNKTFDLLTVENPLVNGRLYYLYIDATNGTLTGAISGWTLNDTKVPVATVLWNNTLTPKYWLAEERHSCLIDRRLHYYEHFTTGVKSITSGAITGQTVNTDSDAAKSCGIGATTIADEDLVQSLGELTDPGGATASYVTFYRTAASTWAWAASDMPFKYNSGTNWIQWDSGGTLTDATGGAGALTRWVNSYLLFTNMQGAARFIFVPGQAIFTTLATAQAESPGSFTWTGFPIAEACIAYRFTWTTITSTSKGQCRLAATPQAVNIGSIAAIGLGTTHDHNTLAGLQGGTAGEYYHLTAAELAQIVATAGAALLHE